MPETHLFLVCGLPGAGRSSSAAQLANDHHAVRMCPDEWMEQLGVDIGDAVARERIEQLQWATAGEIMKRGTSVVIDWGLWKRSERDRLRVEARSIGVEVHLVLLDPAIDVLWERIEARRHEPHLATVTRADLEQWYLDLERPDVDELATYDPIVGNRIRGARDT